MCHGPGSGTRQDAQPRLHRDGAPLARPHWPVHRGTSPGAGITGITVEAARQQVEAISGQGQQAPPGHFQFTPQASKVLESSSRQGPGGLGHNYVGTEHLLLGLIGEGDNAAVQVLNGLGVGITVRDGEGTENTRGAVDRIGREPVPSGVLRGRPGYLRLSPRLKTPCRSRARRRARPLQAGRCPWVASHEGSEAFPVVSTGSGVDLRPRKGLLARPCCGTEV